jgi:hypothetical protein
VDEARDTGSARRREHVVGSLNVGAEELRAGSVVLRVSGRMKHDVAPAHAGLHRTHVVEIAGHVVRAEPADDRSSLRAACESAHRETTLHERANQLTSQKSRATSDEHAFHALASREG